ncbi:hypothetical protein FOA43_001657 [Brettanomyces nanus]|uniref:DNA mismatch repair protein S5 domain-containing protein n=1 Tax=Eeniella nana TaxID=13502 RepID=A0A875RNZ3_EENNA|nr:uncharacterized protein FOA43_001657 [Brettanomyces nanus]QPG74330.1 hypothetical protein FOA43_001657 [Brettanomyces nanus]
MSIRRLPKHVFSSILSNSSIYSQLSVVKELVENSIDALEDVKNAQVYVEIDVKTGGLNHLLVKDNGAGVAENGQTLMCLNGTTSKLTSMTDLDKGVKTCGFRGEALYFISQIASSLVISTRTKDGDVCRVWRVNKQGFPDLVPDKLAGPVGTTVKIEGLFKSAPVRRKFLEKHVRKTAEQVYHMILAYAFIHRSIRFQLRLVNLNANGNVVSHSGKDTIFLSKLPRVRLLFNILKLRSSDSLYEVERQIEVSNSAETFYSVKLDAILPKMRAQDEISAKRHVKVLTVNNRPLSLALKFGRKLSRIVNQAYTENLLLAPSIWYLSLSIPAERVDVNIEPAKSDIMVSHENILFEEVLKTLVTEVCHWHQLENESTNIPQDPLPDISVESVRASQADRSLFVDSIDELQNKSVSKPMEYINPLDLHKPTVPFKDSSDSIGSHSDLDIQLIGYHHISDDSSFTDFPDLHLNDPASPSIRPKVQSLLPVIKMPSTSEMSQHTLGLVEEAEFQPSNNSAHRKRVLLQEYQWAKRAETPSVLIRTGFTVLYERSEGEHTDADSLNINLGELGIYKITV